MASVRAVLHIEPRGMGRRNRNRSVAFARSGVCSAETELEEELALTTSNSVDCVEAAMLGVEPAQLGERVVIGALADVPVFGLARVQFQFLQVVEDIDSLRSTVNYPPTLWFFTGRT
jgi:hypothetical protein